MIKFFRHIRRSLLEQNKMGKYFKYVIGEILLVVIGILIALQISNWNENRENLKKANKYLTEVKHNIETDIRRIDELNVDNTNKNKSLIKAQGLSISKAIEHETTSK